jgi:uncharacterized protein (TIGR02246 family)
MIGAALALAGEPAMAQPSDTAGLREELMALEKAGWGYLRDRNYDAIRDYMADDGLWIFVDGSRYNKRQTLELMKDFTLVGDIAIEPTYAVRLLSPDVATLLYRITYTSKGKDGPARTVTVLSSSVYARRNGKWWSVLYQESPLK